MARRPHGAGVEGAARWLWENQPRNACQGTEKPRPGLAGPLRFQSDSAGWGWGADPGRGAQELRLKRRPSLRCPWTRPLLRIRAVTPRVGFVV